MSGPIILVVDRSANDLIGIDIAPVGIGLTALLSRQRLDCQQALAVAFGISEDDSLVDIRRLKDFRVVIVGRFCDKATALTGVAVSEPECVSGFDVGGKSINCKRVVPLVAIDNRSFFQCCVGGVSVE